MKDNTHKKSVLLAPYEKILIYTKLVTMKLSNKIGRDVVTGDT